MATDKAPTQAEIDAAQAVMRRAAEAQAKEAQAKLQPIRDITGSSEFAKVAEMVNALPNDFMADMSIAPHIMAIRAGINGLSTIAPAQSEEAPALPAPAA